MEKENYLNEAFTALNCLDEDVFEINSDGLVQAQDFVNDTEDTEEIETVIDPLAETEEDLQDSYIGDVILDCTICQSKIYKKPEEVIVDEEAALANVGEICPYCQSSDGFKVIGQVAEYCPDCEDEEKEDSDIESEEEKGDKIEESLKEDMHGSFKWELKDADGNLIDSESGFNSEDEAKENAIKEIDVFNTSLRRHPDWKFNVINTSEQGQDNWTKLKNFLGENLEKDEEDIDEEITTKKGIKKQYSMRESKGRHFFLVYASFDINGQEEQYTLDEITDYKADFTSEEKARKAAIKFIKDVKNNTIKLDQYDDSLKVEQFSGCSIIELINDGDDTESDEIDFISIDDALKSKNESIKTRKGVKKHSSMKEDYDDEEDYYDDENDGEEEGYALYLYKASDIDNLQNNYDVDFNTLAETGEEENFDDISSCAVEWDYEPYRTLSEAKKALNKAFKDKSDILWSFTIRDIGDDYSYVDGDLLLDRLKSILNSKNESLKEDFNKVEIETDTQKMTMESDKSGKVEVKTEPKSDIKSIEGTGEEMIAPVEPDVEAKFETEGSEEEIMEPEKEYSDIDVDEFDENEFDELGERYLRKTYENVESYKTTKGSTNGNKLKLEGIITFKSGKKAKTNFIFEAKTITKTGKVKFEGMNKQFARGKAFTLTGRMDGNKLLSESLQYNYRCKDVDGKSKRIYGRICR